MTLPSAAPTRSRAVRVFKALLDRIVANGVNTVIVEDASRFARTVLVQEAGIAMLVGLGVRVLTSRGGLTEQGQRYRVTYAGETIIEGRRNPIFDACLALLARGITGQLKVWRPGKTSADMQLDIERGAVKSADRAFPEALSREGVSYRLVAPAGGRGRNAGPLTRRPPTARGDVKRSLHHEAVPHPAPGRPERGPDTASSHSLKTLLFPF
jgi:hypothetical protein